MLSAWCALIKYNLLFFFVDFFFPSENWASIRYRELYTVAIYALIKQSIL